MTDGNEDGATHPVRGGRPAPKGGRGAVVARVLDAAEVLFSEHAYAAVSVRTIADAAGVSHALVHRYIGTKADIMRAVLARHEGGLAAMAAHATTIREAAALMLGGDMERTRRYFRLVLRASMDSVLREVTDVDFPATRLLAGVALAQTAASGREPEIDPRVAVAAVVSLVVGFAGLESDLVREVGLSETPKREIDGQLGLIVDALLRASVPEPPATPQGSSL